MRALEQSWAGPGYPDDELAEPQPSLMLKDAILKWYDVAPPDEPVPLAIRALARRCLRDATKDGTLGVEDGLGYVVLRRCRGDVYVLHVSAWRGPDDRWQTVWVKRGEDVLFHPGPGDGHDVAELGPVAHECEAWARYLRSPRDEAARRAYLRDCYSGLV